MILRSLTCSAALLAVAASSASAALPTVKPTDVRITEGDQGVKVVRVAVALPKKARKTVRVRYATGAGSATSADFTASKGRLAIRKGARRATIALRVVGDRLPEADERFVVRLSSASGARLAKKARTASVTIVDDDKAAAADPTAGPKPIGFNDAIGAPPTEPTVAFDPAAVIEPSASGQSAGHGAAIRLSAKHVAPVTVSYKATAESAAMPADITIPAGQVTFAPGETEKVIPGAVTGDSLDEADETVRITLSDPKGAKIVNPEGTLKIIDAADDGAPQVSVGNAAYSETAGTKVVDVPVTLSAPSGKPVTVDVKTQNGAAKAGLGLDYTAMEQTLTFAPGETTKNAGVLVHNDIRDEDTQTFDLLLSNAVNASIADGVGAVTITDNDAAPTVSIGDVLRLENNVAAPFSVTLSAPSDKQVTVSFATSNGTAASGICGITGDYEAKAMSLIFPPGSTSATVNVDICEDNTVEPDQTFNGVLSSPVNATLGDETGVATIQNDD